MNPALKLPARRVTGWSGTTGYLQSNFSWTGKLPRASDRTSFPVAWTPYLQSLAAGQTEALWGSTHLIRNPPRWFCVQNCPVRLPRVCICDFTAFPNLNIPTTFGAITGQLDSQKVMVFTSSVSAMQSYNTVFRMFLPHESVAQITHTTNGLGNFTGSFPVVNPANWQGGEVLYIHGMNTTTGVNAAGPVVFAPGSVSCPAAFIVDEMAEWNAFGIASLAQQRPRYSRVGYHFIFAMKSAYATIPTWTTGGFRQAQRDFIPYIINQTGGAVNNVTHSIYDEEWPANQSAIQQEIQNVVRNFFSL